MFGSLYRSLTRHPGLSLAIISTLALAMSATVIVSALIDTYLLAPLPQIDDRGVMLVEEYDRETGPGRRNRVSWDTARDVQTEIQAFRRTGIVANASFTVHGRDTTEVAYVPEVSPGFFPALNVHAALGDVINENNAERDGQPALLLSDSLWRRRFGADPSVVGRTVQLDDRAAVVVGVLAPGFELAVLGSGQQAWLAMNPATRGLQDRSAIRYFVFGELAPGVSVARARAELQQLGDRLQAAFPATNGNRAVSGDALRDRLLGPFASQLWILLATAVLVLLVACLNSGALLLAQALARRREIAVRLALGAGTGRLLRQFWRENLTLTLIAAGLAVLLANWTGPLLLGLVPSANGTGGFAALSLGGVAWMFAVGSAVLAALIFGLMPWWIARHLPLEQTLRGGGRTGGAGLAGRCSRWLVTGQIAIAVALAVGAALLGTSSRKLAQVDYGFPAGELFQFRVSTRGDAYREEANRTRFFERVRDELAGLPGVAAVSLAGYSYASPPVAFQSFVQEGDGLTLEESPKQALLDVASPEFRDTHDVRLVRGRWIEATDRADHPRVTVVSAALAERYWPGQDPVGQRVRLNGSGDDWWTVVGVVSDRLGTGHRPRVIDTFITPLAQLPPAGIAVMVRFRGAAPPAFATLQRTVWSIDPDVSVFFESRVDEFYAASAWQQRFSLVLIGAFALLAVTLCVAGLYAMLAFTVTSRTRELGVRAALGASAQDIRRHVLGAAAGMIAPGVIIGLGLAMGAGQSLRSLLYNVPSLSPAVFAATAAIITLVCFAAALIPAGRATAVDPAVALRNE